MIFLFQEFEIVDEYVVFYLYIIIVHTFLEKPRVWLSRFGCDQARED